MDILSGAKRLGNRRKAKPTVETRQKERGEKEERPSIEISPEPFPALLTSLPTATSSLPEEYSRFNDEDKFGIAISYKEKDIISTKSLQQRRNLPEFEILDIQYSIISDEELNRIAVFEARNTDDEGLHSVNDPRSGTVDNHLACNTCHLDNLECSGHVGIIKLRHEILHPLFRREVVDILISVCGSCGGLLLPYDTIREKGFLNLAGSDRLRAIAKASQGLPCRRSIREQDQDENELEEDITPCIANPIYQTSKLKETGKVFYTREKKTKGAKTNENIRSVKEIETILNSISKEDAAILGFSGQSSPANFIMKSIPIIPLCARAPVMQNGMLVKDDLTSIYKDIVRFNNELKRDDLTELERETKLKGMIFAIEHMINNSDKKYGQGKKKIYKSILDRVQGKEGLIRESIMGKRVNFSARTVLSPDPTLRFGQIRVPRAMAPYLSQHEIVTPENLRKMTTLLRKGKITYLVPSNGKAAGKKIRVNAKIQKEHTLVSGDEVDRWLENGDWVVFNRQPTLHKQGIMGFEVVLGAPSTIGLTLSVTRAFNADFDGDEGNLFAPQSEDARREVAGIMAARCNIMSAQTNSNIAGVVFDALSGSYILSLPETVVDERVFMEIRMVMEDQSTFDTLHTRLDKYNVPWNSGRALLSSLFPEDFFYIARDTVIREGILISGTLNKDNIGSNDKSIIQALFKDYGQERTVMFLTDIYSAAGYYLDTHGFSVDMADCFLQGKDPQKTIEYEIQRSKMLVKAMGAPLEDPLEEERREKQIRAYLDTAKNFGAKISKENLAADNSFNIMAKSGSKGSVTNISQITAILGQQFAYGERMPLSMSGNKRASPYYRENDLDPVARGFITNSYLTGLTPAELFFGLAGARQGVVDSTNKVALVGHQHRMITKALEDVKTHADGSVRNSVGIIFQYSYSEDSMSGDMIEGVKTSSGMFTSFIDLKRAAGRINSFYGF
jgi:DNA-directed RNA polymerase II subunit RPB1